VVRPVTSPDNVIALLSTAGLSKEAHDGLVNGWKFIYSLPAMAGLGKHWELSQPEAENLTVATEGAVKSLASSQTKAVVEAMNKYMPLTALAGVVFMTTYTRWQITNALRAGGATNAEVRADNPGRDENASRANATERDIIRESPAAYAGADSAYSHVPV
jgi:alpha-ketoglutarate-dependent taurine dioxygenase